MQVLNFACAKEGLCRSLEGGESCAFKSTTRNKILVLHIPKTLSLETLLDDIVWDGGDGLCLHILEREPFTGACYLPLGHWSWLCKQNLLVIADPGQVVVNQTALYQAT